MSQIYRVFVRHENDAQPAYIKVRSEKNHDDFLQELEKAIQQPAPATWRCVDINMHTWIFRVDKIYTFCVYPPEQEIMEYIEDQSQEVAAAAAAGPATDPGLQPVPEIMTYDDLDAAKALEEATKDVE